MVHLHVLNENHVNFVLFKVIRNNNDLEKKYSNILGKVDDLETELFEKNETLTKLTTVSKNLFKEYDTLKNQYEAETSAMHRALNDASQWYRENKALRRRTMLTDKDTVDEGVDTDEPADTDLENLRESVKQLSQEVAQLQAELSAVKLMEFEACESNANLTQASLNFQQLSFSEKSFFYLQELEHERNKNKMLEIEIQELKENMERTLRVSSMMKRELEDLKALEAKEKENAVVLRKEADNYKRERNVLAHQSTLLMQGLNGADGMDTVMLLQEIEQLKSTLEDERNQYHLEISNMHVCFYTFFISSNTHTYCYSI